jgi:hypothetical protein
LSFSAFSYTAKDLRLTAVGGTADSHILINLALFKATC